MSSALLSEYLADPFLKAIYKDIKNVGSMKPMMVEITQNCNLRCEGCFFFTDKMDRFKAPKDEKVFDEFLQREKERGTNDVLVVGGEPALMLPRVKKIVDTFRTVTVVTNGVKKIPMEGFENIALAISVWGDHETDTLLRGKGTNNIFEKALTYYKDDPRARWYYTASAGNADQIEGVVDEIVENGNVVLFNYYGDLASKGSTFDHTIGFKDVAEKIDAMILKHPKNVIFSSYTNHVITTGTLYDQKWGYDVCPTMSNDRVEADRLATGNPLNPHFKVFAPDLKTTKLCCQSLNRKDCSICFDTWAHEGWIMLNLQKHLGSKQEFTNWLSAVYVYYLTNGALPLKIGRKRLPEMHRRVMVKAEEG
ncbi:MAG: radical SAM protein [Fibrobacterales bacterium]